MSDVYSELELMRQLDKAQKRIVELEARVKELHDFNLVLCEWKEGDGDASDK